MVWPPHQVTRLVNHIALRASLQTICGPINDQEFINCNVLSKPCAAVLQCIRPSVGPAGAQMLGGPSGQCECGSLEVTPGSAHGRELYGISLGIGLWL